MLLSQDEATGKGLGKFGIKRRNVKSSEDPAAGQPLGSPRKRESGGSGRGAGERQSFFAGLRPRSRQDGGNANAVPGSNRPFSRFVPKRLGNSSQADLKSQISGPTGTPQYDSAGDTARRSRASANSDKAAGDYESWSGGATPTTAEMSKEGSVMSRIRPVDFEGWMKKKGERYNAWKPRYLALKGSDLVILRDPEVSTSQAT
jgi:PH domain